MHLKKQVLLFVVLCLVGAQSLFAQSETAWRDSVQAKMKLLRELVQEDNYEDAQLESDAFRVYLRSKVIHFPPAALSTISSIYFHNKDRKSALQTLAEAEQDAQRDRNPVTRMALLNTILKEQTRWENPERAEIVRQMLEVARDSVAARQLKERTQHYQKQIDSLQRELKSAHAVKDNTLSIDKYRAFALAGMAALVILALILVHLNNNSRWRRRWESRELEWELRTAGQTTPDPVPDPENTIVTSQETAVTKTPSRSVSAYEMSREEAHFYSDKTPQIALVIESNRQVALYVRSMLNSNFEVETASSTAEALKMAHEILPDLIVCDAHLSGNAGIDIVRQIKLSDRTNHIPVVLLSRHHGTEGRLDALRAGADAWFTRPMQSEDFNLTVRHLIDSQKERHEAFARYLQLYYSDNRPPQPSRFVTDIMGYIEQDMAKPDLMPDEIARKMQLSNPLFVRKLRALSGKDPARLIKELRLEKARFLLEKKAGTPQAISEMVGFSNPGIFSMAFKDYFGENTMLLTGGNKGIGG